MKRVCLVIIDGFGLAENDSKNNATKSAVFIEKLKASNPYFRLFAHGEFVGLPRGFMGNSEVGHMTIGGGRIIQQSLLRINHLYETGEFRQRIVEVSRNFGKRIHIIGLLSDGGVHSHIDHLKFLLKTIPRNSNDVFVHAIADGRDTAPREFNKYFEEIDEIASVAGRYYTMDRDNNTDRIEKAFQMMTNGNAAAFNINDIYQSGVTDEFIEPVLIKQERIHLEDTIIFFNFRADRMRQIYNRFHDYKSKYTMTEYEKGQGIVLFPSESIKNTLPECLSLLNIRQAHIAETEKYAHVTYFFNGGNERKYTLESRFLINSPKVSNFDEKPETAMKEVAKCCIERIKDGYEFIVVNFAGPDLVGHTGNLAKTKESVKILDNEIEKIYNECVANSFALLITADHGNSEQMRYENEVCKSHTCNRVPLIIINSGCDFISGKSYSLADIAPTILDLMGANIPDEMTGKSIIRK